MDADRVIGWKTHLQNLQNPQLVEFRRRLAPVLPLSCFPDIFSGPAGKTGEVGLPHKVSIAPDIDTTKGLRDPAILAVLLGCGLRRFEVAALRFTRPKRDGR
jgi:integrase